MKLQRLIDLRTDADLSCAKFARLMGVSDRVMLYYEKGEHTIPLEMLIKIADYFNVSVDYLLERTNKRELNK